MDFASLFQKSSSSAEAEKPANGLSSLFSDAAKQKFARSFKQTEFVPKEKEVVEEPEPEMDERLKAKREKRKLRNMKSKPGVEENGGKQPSTETPSEVKVENPETNEESQSVEPVVTEASKKEKDERTIFVGNIPISCSTDKLSKLFSEYGAIESIRLRSVPVSGAKVDKAGDQDLVRKVCVNNKKFGEQKGSVNAYIVFKDKASVSEALKANNMLLEKRHLRVDTANPSLFDPKRTLFVGGLPFYADEEEIREYFAAVSPNDIRFIRM
jgi:RNA recognition motif-containing protein